MPIVFDRSWAANATFCHWAPVGVECSSFNLKHAEISVQVADNSAYSGSLVRMLPSFNTKP